MCKYLKMKNRVLLLLLALVIVPFACTAPATEPDNQAVKRNINRFPSDFMFQLDLKEFTNLKSQKVISC